MWYKNPLSTNISLKIYRFIRIIARATCSPFLLKGTFREHEKDYEQIDKSNADVILTKFYADNLSTGVKGTSTDI